MSTLVVHFTPKHGSRTKRLLDAYVAKLPSAGDVTMRDISATDLPNITTDVLAEFYTPSATTEFMQESPVLVDELKAAEHLVIAAPMYNFGVPAQVKSWIDLVTMAGQTFMYGEAGPVGLLDLKKVTIIATSGGVPFASPVDFLTPALKTITGFWAKSDPEFEEIQVSGLDYVSPEEAEAKIDEVIAGMS